MWACCKFVHVILVLLSSLSYGQNQLFVSKQFADATYKCVSPTDYALTWVTEEIKTNLAAVSTVVPTSKPNTFDSTIANDQQTKKYFAKHPWTLKNSVEDNLGDVILDRRWEEMTQLTTDFVSSQGKYLEYQTVLSNLKNNFEIPLSIRTEKEAHIFLCNGDSPPESDCYWLMLQAFNDTTSNIRKCRKNLIQARSQQYPEEPCRTPVVRLDHSVAKRYLFKDKWSHFKLTKKGNYISFGQLSESGLDTILEWTDLEEPFIVTHLIIHSKQVRGLWKVHDAEYIYTKEESSNITLGPSFNSTEGFVCISMFVSMCNRCRLELKLEASDGNYYGTTTFEFKKRGWNPIKYVSTNVPSPLKLSVSTKGNSQNRFWAIDEVRLCQNQEYRVIQTEEEANCQLMSPKGEIISHNIFQRRVSIPVAQCPEDTIGEFCVPCKLLYQECSKIEICTTENCFCSAGYRNAFFKNWECSVGCNLGYYGHGCKKRCGNCYNTCNIINGSCFNCTDGFSGPKCDQPPAVYFKREPEITNVGRTSVNVNVPSEVENTIPGEVPQYYSIQCKNILHERPWLTCSPKILLKLKSVLVGNLEPEENYMLRAVITTNKNRTYDGPLVKTNYFRTGCQELDLVVRPENTSVRIYPSRIAETTCNLTNYRTHISGLGEYQSFHNHNSSIYFGNLTPFTNYTLIFRKKLNTESIPFQTTEGVPEEVRRLTIRNVSQTSFQVRWLQPAIYGEFRHYVVEYQHLGYVACREQYPFSSERKILHVRWPSVTIINLIPYSRYAISVFVVNNKFAGNTVNSSVNTLESSQIALEELPRVVDISPDTNSAEVTLKLSDCSRRRGEIQTSVICKCRSEWCNQIKYPSLFVSNDNFRIGDLMPFSNYYVELRFCRRKQLFCSNIVTSRNFSTKTQVPYQVRDLSAYSKNDTTVSLRWKPPYPPTGYLAEYEIRGSVGRKTFKTMQCKLWTDYHCVTLTSLQTNIWQSLGVSARNIESNFGRSVFIDVTTKKEPSQPPYDLNLTWSTTNDLLLSWKHPNISNGGIEYFQISATTGGNTVSRKLFVTEETYNLTYYYKIEASELLPEATYSIVVSAFNGENGRHLNAFITSPPFVARPNLSLLGLLVLLLLIPAVVLVYKNRNKISFAKLNPFTAMERDTPLDALSTDEIGAPQHQLNTSRKQKVYSKRVEVEKLEEYIKNAVANCELDRQHALLPSGQIKSSSYGALAENTPKNRNVNAIAYDHTRVILEKINGKEHSDYINANYIDGYNEPRAYIATQGPKLSTTVDFWRMVWQEKVEYIVALTQVHENDEKKFEKYWPELNEKFSFGDILVERASLRIFTDYQHRVFTVMNNGVLRTVHHYQYLSWPEHGLPFHSQSLVNFLEIMQTMLPKTRSPVVVHCREGFGKTGTVILCDVCLRMAAEERAVDLLGVFQKIRNQRPNMVEFVYQYKLAHLIILEYLFDTKTSIPCDQIIDVVGKMKQEEISSQLSHLEETMWFRTIVPEIQGYGFIPFNSVIAGSTAINAVSVDGFRSPGRFIAAQQPTSNTVEVFWRLVAEKKVSLIISLNQNSYHFWPTDSNQCLVVDGITVTHTKTRPLEFGNLTSIQVIPKSSKKQQTVKILEIANWPSDQNCPESIENFLKFWEKSYAMFKESTPVLTCCFDGTLASGLYLALSFTIEKMELEQICDVYQAVKTIRRYRQQFVPNEEQFSFLYKAAAVYAKMFQGYANFVPPVAQEGLYCEIR